MPPVSWGDKPVNFLRDIQPILDEHCVKCHSADYIYMQPPLTEEQWQATVMKMKKTYGAPIDDGETGTIVNYLKSQNGTSQ